MSDQTEQREVLQALSELLSDKPEAAARLSSQCRRGISRLKAAIEDTDLESVIRCSKNESLTVPPHSLTDPEDLKYFKLYRESFTVEHIHVPEAQRKNNRSHGCGSAQFTCGSTWDLILRQSNATVTKLFPYYGFPYMHHLHCISGQLCLQGFQGCCSKEHASKQVHPLCTHTTGKRA